MGLITNRVDINEIKPGDHIYTYRAVFAYSHHGYYFFIFFLYERKIAMWALLA